MIPNYNTKMSKVECREYKKVNNYSVSSSRESGLQISEGGISQEPERKPKKQTNAEEDKEDKPNKQKVPKPKKTKPKAKQFGQEQASEDETAPAKEKTGGK